MKIKAVYLLVVATLFTFSVQAQESVDSSRLTIDRIFNNKEFHIKYMRPIQWIENGDAYVTIEKSKTVKYGVDLVKWECKSQKRSTYISAKSLIKPNGKSISIEGFSLSPEGSKVLIFTNSSRVWRSNTKGDFWVYDMQKKQLKQLGKQFKPSSLMFAKFSPDDKYVAYVHDFNIYKENFESGKVTQLTFDGDGKLINGTFDWAYEEEFGKRNGFKWNSDATKIAFWHLDASKTGTYYMINYTDSVYSVPIPIQYPVVGQEPSATKVGLINMSSNKISWIPVPGNQSENYIPGMQWVNSDLLLIQQLNRKQNKLIVWSYVPSTKKLKNIYTEVQSTFIELQYPDITSSTWNSNDLPIVDKSHSFLRMTETDKWRHVYKIDISSGAKTLITPFDFDIASITRVTKNSIYFIASPNNSTQRYLYKSDLVNGKKLKRITPKNFNGVNTYNISTDGKYALHTFQSTSTPYTVDLVSLPKHKIIKTLISNSKYKKKLKTLALPDIKFTKVTTVDGINIDVRMILPPDFDSTKTYPVLFHVYGEPWGQVATDIQVGLWNVFLAQKGYIIVDMDNRGTPCLKGSEWRKCIYRKLGVINARDQAMAAKEIIKLNYIDSTRTAVWGWSGGGSMTLNLMFKYADIYKTGMAVAAVANQLTYDNIYQERYMGLPQENLDDFVNGSPMTYAKNLKGNLLIVQGTGDDNVHYSNMEMLVNKLIRYNKQFQMMAYPNRSHGIYEGVNTRKHLYTLLTNYLLTHNPVNK